MLQEDKLTKLLYMSKIVSAQGCPMKYYLQHHLHIQPKQRPAYFDFGSIFHKAALEIGIIKGFPAAEAVLSQNLELMRMLGVEIEPEVLALFQSLSEEDRELMLIMLDTFETKFESMNIKTVFGVENTVKYPIESDFFTHWCIKKDLFFEDDEGLWIGDLKTTSKHGASTAKYYHNSFQTKTYFYIAQRLMPNLRGTKIFTVTKQKIRCEVETILLTEQDKYEAELFIQEAIQAIDHMERTQLFPRMMSHCYNFMGQECSYIPLCLTKHKSEMYVQDLIDNWYKIESPDLHLELKES